LRKEEEEWDIEGRVEWGTDRDVRYDIEAKNPIHGCYRDVKERKSGK
jgi:hypothetical protein